LSEDEAKSAREEGKSPVASLKKSKKEREGNDNITRVPTPMFIAPPKTPVASKLRKNAQAKALAAEKMAVANETESPGDEGDIEKHEIKIKKKRRIEEEEEEDRRETTELQAELKEQDRLEYEDEMLGLEDSDEEDSVMVSAFLGDAR
jgi:hypothetical protein